MAVETLTTPRSNLPNVFTDINAREIDFVTRFGRNWTALREIMGIMRPIKKQAGTVLKSYTASVSLADGEVPEGAVIPYSKATVVETLKEDLSLLKYAKAVSIEDVNRYGAEIAVEKTDEAFLNELQTKVMTDFYTFLNDDTYAITDAQATWQAAVSIAIGKVKAKFQAMRKDLTSVVVFVNTMDVYKYLGSANISVQTAFGIDYVKNFLGAQTMILTTDVPEGTVIAVPSDNIVLYYIDPSDAEIRKLGLDYTTDGETNLIGFHANGNYTTAVGENFALMGMKLWAEYADGIAIVTVDGNF